MSSTLNKPNPIISFLTNKRLAWLRHILFILFLAQSFGVLTPDSFMVISKQSGIPFTVLFQMQLVQMVFSAGFIYFNLYFLFPRFFKKELYFKYILGIILTAVAFFLMCYSIQFLYLDKFKNINVYKIGFTFADIFEVTLFPIVYILATTGYKIFKESLADQQKFATLEKEKLKAELSQLKSQVNPHFLFNTLNNLHVLIQSEPKKASEIVLGLSDVLRYQIYDSQLEKVPLTKDIEIIEQYLELEKIRRNDLTFKVEKKSGLNNIFVPPLLFINFVDNAIKHGNSCQQSFINMSFEVKDKKLNFEISNSKPNQKNHFESSGLGLNNIKKRLDLQYGINHNLEIKEEKSIYTVKLNFPI